MFEFFFFKNASQRWKIDGPGGKWRHAMTSCKVMPWCQVTSWHRNIGQGLVSVHSIRKPGNNVFELGDLDIWPLTLTIKVMQDIIKVNPCTKFGDHTSNGSAVRALTDRQTDTHTHSHTDGSVFITSTANAGGNDTLCSKNIRYYGELLIADRAAVACLMYIVYGFSCVFFMSFNYRLHSREKSYRWTHGCSIVHVLVRWSIRQP